MWINYRMSKKTEISVQVSLKALKWPKIKKARKQTKVRWGETLCEENHFVTLTLVVGVEGKLNTDTASAHLSCHCTLPRLVNRCTFKRHKGHWCCLVESVVHGHYVILVLDIRSEHWIGFTLREGVKVEKKSTIIIALWVEAPSPPPVLR